MSSAGSALRRWLSSRTAARPHGDRCRPGRSLRHSETRSTARRRRGGLPKPSGARRLQGLRGLPIGGVRVRKAGPAIGAQRLVGGVEGEDRRCILARLHGFFRPATHRGFAGPIRVGDQEARVIDEAVAAALPERAPVIERRGDADCRRISVGWSRSVGRRILRPAGRRGGQEHRKKKSKTPHAGHPAHPLLIRH